MNDKDKVIKEGVDSLTKCVDMSEAQIGIARCALSIAYHQGVYEGIEKMSDAVGEMKGGGK